MSAVDRHALLHATSVPDPPAPQVQLLSNGIFHVMVTNAGAGATVALRDDGKEHPIEFEFHTPVKAPSNLPARARNDFQAAR